MAEDTIKGFTVHWIMFGLLFTCLLSFAISFMYANNPIGLTDGAGNAIDGSYTEARSTLYEAQGDANELLNLTAETNPEVSYLGSRDSVATSYSLIGSAKKNYNSAKSMIGWVFSGDIGKLLLSVFGGLIGTLGLYYGIKLMRTGN
jgi:hypothetical protein